MQLAIIFILLIGSLLGGAAWLLAKSVSRLLGLVLFLITPPMITFAFISMMGTAKPIYPPYLNIDGAYNRVVWSNPVEGVAIYVIALDENMKEPRLYALPWENGTAERIQQSLTDGHLFIGLKQDNGGTGNIKTESQPVPLPDPPKDYDEAQTSRTN